MPRHAFLIPLVALCLLAVACGNGGIGDVCQGPTVGIDDCVPEAICTQAPPRRDEPGAPNEIRSFCRRRCQANAECVEDGEGFTCRRVEGTMEFSCQPPRDDT
ncbi:MAG: hypothetical protein ACFCGT_12860 [Sandaracinaceae bacterium]